MDTLVDLPWSTEHFLAWEDRQEGKHEFDGLRVLPMTGGSVAHQDIVFNLRVLLARLLSGTQRRALQEMRLRIGPRIRYPDVLITPGPLGQAVQTLDDALVIFEVLSDDTAAIDRVDKLIDYARVPSLRYYVMLEQTSRAAIVCQPAAGGEWTTTVQAEAAIVLPDLDLALPLDDVYHGLIFATPDA